MWAKRRVSVFGAALFFKLLTDHKEPATETRHPKWSLIHWLSRSLAVCRSFFQFSVSLPVLSASSSLVPQSPAAVIKSIYSTGNRDSFAFFLPNFQKSDALDPTQPTGSDDDACSLQRLKSLCEILLTVAGQEHDLYFWVYFRWFAVYSVHPPSLLVLLCDMFGKERFNKIRDGWNEPNQTLKEKKKKKERINFAALHPQQRSSGICFGEWGWICTVRKISF